MCLRPGEEIGDEVHSNVDQFFRIEQGEAKFVFNEKVERSVHVGDAVVVPAGTYHNIVNTSKTAMLKLHTIYSALSFGVLQGDPSWIELLRQLSTRMPVSS
jgi:mannose-6-phosphate isomerase-like protein (cupin superfamily)